MLFEPNGFLDRNEAGLPPDYCPDAQGIQFAGRGMLKRAGCTSRARRPSRWQKIGYKDLRKDVRFLDRHEAKVDGYDRLQVRQIDRCKAWVVERVDLTDEYQTLTIFDVPIVARSRREAMFLAEFFLEAHARLLVGCAWRRSYCKRWDHA